MEFHFGFFGLAMSCNGYPPDLLWWRIKVHAGSHKVITKHASLFLLSELSLSISFIDLNEETHQVSKTNT